MRALGSRDNNRNEIMSLNVQMNSRRGRVRRRSLVSNGGKALSAAFMVALLGGCDGILDVSLPGQTEIGELANPRGAQLLVVSAQGDFECAYNRYVRQSGLISGELLGSLRAITDIPYMERNVLPIHTGFGESNCASGASLYTPLAIARFAADDATARVEEFSAAELPNREALLARAALFAGYSYAVLGEGFCEAAFDGGPALTPQQIFELAENRFTKAIEAASVSGQSDLLNAARVGRARVRLPLGNAAGAAQDASQVPPGFTFYVTRSNAEGRRQNQVYMDNYRSETVTVGTKYWNVEWEGVPDPRVAVEDMDRVTGGDNQTRLVRQLKYTAPEAPIRLASYTEAQLIRAEVEGGQVAVGIINALHAAVGLPPFVSDDPEEIRQQVIEQRRRELFLEGHRMGDLRRFGGFAEWAEHGQPHPYANLTFGSTSCFPLPDVERANNPNIS